MHSNVADDVVITMTKNDNCPKCGYRLNAATGQHGYEVPKVRDLSVCINCASLLEFNDDLSLRSLSDLEISTLADDVIEEVQTIQRFIRSQKTHYH